MKTYALTLAAAAAVLSAVTARAAAPEADALPAPVSVTPGAVYSLDSCRSMALVNNNAAVIIEEKDLTGERLTQEVNRLLADRDRLRILGENAKKMAIPDTVERIADILFRLAKA